eukprot:12695255-Alexandrium_andersonii.AAC.1
MADAAASELWITQTAGLVAYQYTHPASRATVSGQWLAGGDAARASRPAETLTSRPLATRPGADRQGRA